MTRVRVRARVRYTEAVSVRNHTLSLHVIRHLIARSRSCPHRGELSWADHDSHTLEFEPATGREVRVVLMEGGISFLKTVNTLLSESTKGRTRHEGGRAFARTCIRHEVRSAEVPKAFFTCAQQMSRSMSM